MGAAKNQLFDDEFLDRVKERLEVARSELAGYEREYQQVQQKRDKAALQVKRLEGLIGADEEADGGQPSGLDCSPLATAPNLPASDRLALPNAPVADADAVVELLRDHPAGLHYVEIHRRILEGGYRVGGRGEPNTLLSRYYNDSRLERAGRGLYALKEGA